MAPEDGPRAQDGDYDGPLDSNEVSLLGKEDALEVADQTRLLSGPRSSHPAFDVLRSGDEQFGLGSFEKRVWQVRAERWTNALWNAYLRSFSAQLGALDIELVLWGNTDHEGWDSAYVVDLRKWERNPRAKPGGELSERWRRRSRWERILGFLF